MCKDKGIMNKTYCLRVNITIVYRLKDFYYETYTLKNQIKELSVKI